MILTKWEWHEGQAYMQAILVAFCAGYEWSNWWRDSRLDWMLEVLRETLFSTWLDFSSSVTRLAPMAADFILASI